MAKKFLGESNTVAVFLSTGKVWIRRGEYQNFPSNFFCLTVPKNFLWESFTVAIISGTENIWISGGGIEIFRRNFLSHSAVNFSRGIRYCCNIFR